MPEDIAAPLTATEDAGLCRHPPACGCAPFAAALALPVFRGGTAPDAVHLVVTEREVQALLADNASGTDHLGPRDLPFGGAGR